MSSKKQVTAIFDIGKTNKKFLLFDENYTVVEKHQTELEQITDDDGDPCEDLDKLETWIQSQYLKAQENYQVQNLNFSAYGASFVHIDQNGKPVTPLYNYLKTYPEELLDQFYELVGGRETFSIQTATPPMGMLNSGLQIYWLQHYKPEVFQRIKTTLHFPNYLSYLFSGKETSELTSIGCHTGLWNFEMMDYHSWLEKEEVQSILPNPQSVTQTVKKNNVNIGVGIHDSSAALAPYLIGLNDPFMLISTGTWSITLNPFNDESLTYRELEKDCLCYLDIYGKQVKASRLFLGAEYSYQKKKISQHFSVNDDSSWMELDVNVLNGLIQNPEKDLKLELEEAHHSGPYPQEKSGLWEVSDFSSPKEAYHQLMLDLVCIQADSIKLAEGSKSIDTLIVTGGFSQNEIYVSLLASFFPDKQIYISKLSNASALGAAMVINEEKIIANGEKQSPDDFGDLLGLKKINGIDGVNLKNYSWV